VKVGDLVRHVNLDEIFVVVEEPVREGTHLLWTRVSVADSRGTRRIDAGFLEVISESR
tara:strand:- start:139 stop:312 length:174 start_codon:yes stop_codon:yes gene_type:complete